MLKLNGEQELRTFTDHTFQESVDEIVPGVWIACSMGHSNAIFIVGDTSVILVDTLDTGRRGERLRDLIKDTTGKGVKTIIYTHNHVDHRGGGGAFDGTDPETIVFAPCAPVLEHTDMVQDELNKRGARQFGFCIFRASRTTCTGKLSHSHGQIEPQSRKVIQSQKSPISA